MQMHLCQILQAALGQLGWGALCRAALRANRRSQVRQHLMSAAANINCSCSTGQLNVKWSVTAAWLTEVPSWVSSVLSQ